MSRIWDKCAELGRQVSNAASETFRFSPGPNTSDLLQSSLFSIKIPCDIHDENLGYIGLAGYRLGHVCSTTPRKATFTPGLAAVLGLVHLNSDGYSAFTTAFSPYRILERQEYHRIITGLAIHPTTAGFLSSLADMYEAAAHLEACWGWKGMVASVLGSSILGSSIYGTFHFFVRYARCQVWPGFYPRGFSTFLLLSDCSPWYQDCLHPCPILNACHRILWVLFRISNSIYGITGTFWL
jgi:hypothetical protein